MTAVIKRRRVNDPYLSDMRLAYTIMDDYALLNWNFADRYSAMLSSYASGDLY